MVRKVYNIPITTVSLIPEELEEFIRKEKEQYGEMVARAGQ